MMRFHRLAFLAAVLVAAGLAFSQSTLGPMFKLGSSTTANLPSSSSLTTGALIYDLDAGAPKYNNGTAWQTLGGGGATFWYDGGPGFIIANEILGTSNAVTPVTMSRTVISPGLTNQGPVLTLQAQVATTSQPTISANTTYNVGLGGGRYSEIQFGFNGEPETQFGNYYQLSTDTHVAGVCANSGQSPSGDRIGFVVKTPGGNRCDEGDFDTSSSTLRMDIDSTKIRALITLQSTVASATDAFKANNNGARIDLGTGTDDYAASDGVGITTPSYWKSNRAFATGAGVFTNRMTLTGASSSSFTSTNVLTATKGTMAFDTTFNKLSVQNTDTSFAPVGPHNTYYKQVISTRIMGVNGTDAYPEVAERVRMDNAGSLLQTYGGTLGAGVLANSVISTAGLERTYYAIQTNPADGAGYFLTTATSGAATTLAPFAKTGQYPEWCQNVRHAGTITSMTLWAGLTDTAPSAASMVGNGAMFRYDPATNTNWDFCTRDNTTTTCINTGVTVSANTAYHLCFQAATDGSFYVWVNGLYVAKATTNLPLVTSTLAPWLSIRNTSGASRAVYVGTYQVEMN